MKYFITLIIILFSSLLNAQTVSTAAGQSGIVGSANGPAANASFNNPHGVACDGQGNTYVANRYGHTIRKISSTGIVSTFAGSGSIGANDGLGTAASFNEPWAIACDTAGNIYVADTKNYKIRKITSAGVVSTIAGTGTFGVTNGPLNIAQFGFPSGIAVSKDGSVIYVSDRMTQTIRKISGGNVSTIAGVVYSPGNIDGPGITAKFDHPYSICLDNSGNVLVADEYNNKIRMITPSGQVSTLAGDGTMGSNDGPALSSNFNSPWGICVDNTGVIYVGDANNFTIRKIALGNVSTYAGQNGVPGSVNGPVLTSSFNGISSLWFNAPDNTLYACDPFSQLIRKITQGTIQTLSLSTSTGSTTFCVGNQVILAANPSNLSNYVFSEGVTILGTSATGTLSLSSLAIGSHNIYCSAQATNGSTITSNTITINITGALQVSIVAQGNTTICNGDSVKLTSSIAGSYLWSTGSTTSFIHATTAGTYTLTVTNSQGCSGQSSPLQVITLQPPAATITAPNQTPVCAGDSIQLTSGTAAAYLWSNGSTSQSTYVTSQGNYTVQVTNGSGCSAISTPINIIFYALTSSTISPAGIILLPQGNSITLTANTGTAYQWSTGALSQGISVNSAGTYTVTVTDANGCLSDTASSEVRLLNSSNIISVNGPLTFCESDSVKLTSAFSNGNQWFKNGIIIPGATQSIYIAKLTGYYKVRYTPSTGLPITSDSILVTVRTIPDYVYASADTSCKGFSSTITAQPQTGIIYNWYTTSTGGTSIATGLSFITWPLTQITSYYIELSNNYGCVRSNRFEVVAMLHPQPTALFNNSLPVSSGTGFEIAFENNSLQGTIYFWDFGDPISADNTSSGESPTHIYSNPGTYLVKLITTNDYGCSDTISKIITVKLNNNIFIPTGFTPNNDGNNDVFRVRGNNIKNCDMTIYNQWGQKVWFSASTITGWDGTMNGQLVANGNYSYVIDIKFENETREIHRGNISLIR